jgi:hypothetical protein
MTFAIGVCMTGELDRETVRFSQRKNIASNENYYQAVDGWWIEKIDGKWIFCASDPGFSAKDIRVQLSQEDFDYVRKNNPSAYEMMVYMKERNLI